MYELVKADPGTLVAPEALCQLVLRQLLPKAKVEQTFETLLGKDADATGEDTKQDYVEHLLRLPGVLVLETPEHGGPKLVPGDFPIVVVVNLPHGL